VLTVLMATRNGASTLPKVLAGYCALVAPPGGYRLIVVDNGSTDQTRAIVESFQDRLPVTYLFEPRAGKNVALNTALGVALQQASTDLLVFTDDDATPVPQWLAELARAAVQQPDYALFGGAIVPDWEATPADWVTRLVPLGLTFGITGPDLPEGPIFAGLIWGANMAVRRRVFDTGYRFDETVGPNGGAYAMGSETQLTRMLADHGEKSWFCPAAVVGHYIRAHQLTEASVVQRAWRFGRGKFRQDRRGPYPYLFGVPRWMFSRYAVEVLRNARARLGGNADARFLSSWEMAYLRGYMHEAWRGGPGPSARRVLITSFSGALGGMELRMAQEARILNAAGCPATLAPSDFPGSATWRQALHSEGLETGRLNLPPVFEQWHWRRLNRWRAGLTGPTQMRRHAPDLVHVAFCWTTYGLSALYVAQRCRLPTIISVHNAFPQQQFNAWQLGFARQAFSTVKGVYAVSDSALQHFLANYRELIPADARLAVIPNSVDTNRFAPNDARRATARASWGIPADALVLGCVARLADQKQPAALVSLFATLHARLPNLYLVLIGTGPLEQDLRADVRRRGLEHRVVFAGFQQQVEQLIPGLDLHILMSRNEGFGIATIEAMACGVPAVGTQVPGTVDVLAGAPGGLLIPPNDEAVSAAAIEALLRDPARRAQMAVAGRADVIERFSEARVAGLVRAFYRGIV
jgi:glycosyltransferase involved in cell wall biosynthesis